MEEDAPPPPTRARQALEPVAPPLRNRWIGALFDAATRDGGLTPRRALAAARAIERVAHATRAVEVRLGAVPPEQAAAVGVPPFDGWPAWRYGALSPLGATSSDEWHATAAATTGGAGDDGSAAATTLVGCEPPHAHAAAAAAAYAATLEYAHKLLSVASSVPALAQRLATVEAASDATGWYSTPRASLDAALGHGAWLAAYHATAAQYRSVVEGAVAAAAPQAGDATLRACRACHSSNVTIQQQQRRSADEPMAEIVLCMACGYQQTYNH